MLTGTTNGIWHVNEFTSLLYRKPDTTLNSLPAICCSMFNHGT